MKQLLLLALLLFSISTVSQAQKLQGQAKIDSMVNALPDLKEDTNKASFLSTLSYNYVGFDYEKGIEYGEQARILSDKLKWNKGRATSRSSIGINYMQNGDYNTALKYLDTAVVICREMGDRRLEMLTLNNVANNYQRLGRYSDALQIYIECYTLSTSINDTDFMGIAAVNTGAIYAHLGEVSKAREYFIKSLGSFPEKSSSNSIVLNNIGSMYLEEGNAEKALEYLNKAKSIADAIKDKSNAALASINLGDVYNMKEQYAKAFEYYTQALKLNQELSEKSRIALVYNKLGGLYVKTDKIAMAIVYYKKSIELFEELGELDELSKVYKNLSEALKTVKNYKESLYAYEQCVLYKDSVFNKENTEKIARLEVKAEYEKKQVADSIQNVEAQKLAAVKLSRQRSFTFGGVGAAVLLLAFSVFVFRNNKKLGFEKQKSEELLHNILPEEIASELKDRGATTAQQYDNVTVLFTDFVDFTQAGEHIGSQALVEELHNCFMAFDNIMDKYGIEKIKTIGDAYLAVCGLPSTDDRHAEKVVSAAKDIRSFMLQRHEQLGDKTFEIRIGVHSGEVVAGIVGVKKFAYDIWGDTVNTAARMESNSEAGKINISQTTYELVKDKFTFTYRGEIEAKGKGMLKMYFVEG